MVLRFSELCIDAREPEVLGKWWSQALGWPWQIDSDGGVVLTPPPGAGPIWLFLAVPEDKAVKNRLHLDFTPDDQRAEVERLLDLGARHVDIGQGQQTWVVLSDPEGNEFCVLAPKPG